MIAHRLKIGQNRGEWWGVVGEKVKYDDHGDRRKEKEGGGNVTECGDRNWGLCIA